MSSKDYDPCDVRYIAVVVKRNRTGIPTSLAYIVAASISKTNCHYCEPKATLKWTVYPVTPNVCSYIHPIQRCTIEVVSATCQLDYVLLGPGYVHDELQFVLQTDGMCVKIWRKEGHPQNIPEYHAFQCGNIIMWAGVSFGYRTNLHTVK
ncbi:hypothetical protein CDAR_456551 [Caerostris darwini]|uniref:Uncharacterized protein n=1 Tax=Caerostris darwini TaxID=1538125 RepID=A0AAV4SS55_9ARAC|nr:hypothetical protein CDAR_456551 [Caerostris darwini]